MTALEWIDSSAGGSSPVDLWPHLLVCTQRAAAGAVVVVVSGQSLAPVAPAGDSKAHGTFPTIWQCASCIIMGTDSGAAEISSAAGTQNASPATGPSLQGLTTGLYVRPQMLKRLCLLGRLLFLQPPVKEQQVPVDCVRTTVRKLTTGIASSQQASSHFIPAKEGCSPCPRVREQSPCCKRTPRCKLLASHKQFEARETSG